MRDCPLCGRDMPADAEYCDCEMTPKHTRETSDPVDAQPHQVDSAPTQAQVPTVPHEDLEEQDLIEEQEDFPEDEESVDGFDSIPDGPLEEISFEEKQEEPAISGRRQATPGFPPGWAIIVFFVLLAAAVGLMAKFLLT